VACRVCARTHEVQPVCFDTSELPFVLIVYQICFRPWHRSVTRFPTLLAQCSVYRGPCACSACGFVCSQSSGALHQRCLPRSCDPAVARPLVRNFVDATPRRARYIPVYIRRICTSRRSLAEATARPTRRIVFLSDRADTGADSFRSIFYRYFEIQGATAFFPKFDSHGLNSHFEILMCARQDTLLVRVIGVDVVVFILSRLVFFTDNKSNLIFYCSLFSIVFLIVLQVLPRC